MENIKNKTKSLIKFLPLFFVIVISLLFYFYADTQYLIDAVGVENAYWLMFFFAMFAGLMTFNTVPYYSLLFLLASSGLDPLWLGLSSALGVMCGDTFSYFLGRNGADVIPTKVKWIFDILQNLAERNQSMFLFVCFIYGAVSPLANDFLTIPAGAYRARVTIAGTKTVAIDSGSLQLEGSKKYTVYARDVKGGGAPFSLGIIAE